MGLLFYLIGLLLLTVTDVLTTAQVVETSVTVNNNSPIQDYVHPDDQTQLTFEMTPGFKPFTILNSIKISNEITIAPTSAPNLGA